MPPTGSISYINHSTSSIHPIASKIEIRKEGKLGRVYYPAAYMTNENLEYYKDAYEIGWKAIVDTYAEATQHVDQGLSLTLFFPDTATTRDLNKAQIYAWRKGIKTLYYIRIRQQALEGHRGARLRLLHALRNRWMMYAYTAFLRRSTYLRTPSASDGGLHTRHPPIPLHSPAHARNSRNPHVANDLPAHTPSDRAGGV